MINQTPSSNDPIHSIFELARSATESLASQLAPLEGRDYLSDDGTDYLDSTRELLDILIRALCSDYRDQACDLLMRSINLNDPSILHSELPNDFDTVHFDHWDYLGSPIDLPIDPDHLND